MTREEFIEKLGASMGHGFTDEELSADLDSLSLPPAEGAEETKSVQSAAVDFLYSKGYDNEGITFNHDVELLAEFAALQNKSQPTAEGAEFILPTDKDIALEIIARFLANPHPNQKANYEREKKAFANGAIYMREVAQKIADKMVEEMRQKLFSMRATKDAMDKLSKDDKLMMYGYHDCINEMLMWTKSKQP